MPSRSTGDIEMAIAMAPGLSSVLVYEGPTPQDVPPLGTNYIQDATTTAQINDVLNRMATDDLAKQLSCSYGFDINLSTVQIFQQYAAQGQSFFLASGDCGAFSTAVDEPADDPYITVVGGTTLTTDLGREHGRRKPLGSRQPRTMAYGLHTRSLRPAGESASSMRIPILATGHQHDGQPRLHHHAQRAGRLHGGQQHKYRVGQRFYIEPRSDFPEAGTSLAAPLWAGLLALANQQAAANGQPPVGFVNPALYAIGKSASYHSCFHDITTGSNTNSSSPTKYQAVAGYDLCTGWGTPIGANLIPALLSPPLDTLRITPPLGFTSQGRSGGPFSVTAQTYTLTNTGSTPLTWSLVNTPSWLNVSATGGTLNPGGPALR